MRLPVNHERKAAAALALAVLTATALAGPAEAKKHKPGATLPLQSPANGPAADFPVVLGGSYTVGNTVFTPSDAMNLDAVGYATTGPEGGSLVSAAHHTLPIPSYAEVTSLDSGRTILVRVDRRGPMDSTDLIQLSPGAAAQLGLTGERAAVRVRRVNPPEQERALLRAGAQAPERMPTPKALLAVLARKLDPNETVMLGRAPGPARQVAVADAAPAAAPTPSAAPRAIAAAPGSAHGFTAKAAASGAPLPRLLAHGSPLPRGGTPAAPSPGAGYPGPGVVPAAIDRQVAAAPAPHLRRAPASPTDIVAVAPEAETRAAARSGMLVVQAGAYSVRANAAAVADKLAGASVTSAGKLWRVRVGPYASRDQAEAALAKVHAAGYIGARIQRAE